MNKFTYLDAHNIETAVETLSSNKNARCIAGGTNLIDLMKENVMRPDELIDVNHLSFSAITEHNGGLRLGATATNADTAYHPLVEQRYPLLSKTILAGASPQLRNMATNGGNLMQRTRCYYFYDTATPCNKREPGSGCSATKGYNRIHAILGQSEECIATHPSDMCVALAALEAVVNVQGKNGERSIPFADFHRLPGDTPEQDNNLQQDEVITSIDLPQKGFPQYYDYVKLRDRSSYAFALVSVAIAFEINNDVISEARIALGGVAHKPWRKPEAEVFLRGKAVNAENLAAAATIILQGAKGYEYNNFKIELAKRAIVRASLQAIKTGELYDRHNLYRQTNQPRGWQKKVTGGAKYAGEFDVPDLAYGVVVSSSIAKGKILSINSEEVEKTEGVLKVFTHKNVKGLARFNFQYKDNDAPPGDHFRYLQTAEISYSMQPVALVVAETFEGARYASSLIKVEYETEESITNLEENVEKAHDPKGKKSGFKPPKSKGKFKQAFSNSEVQLNATYFHGAEHHNPMEMHTSTVVYDGEEKLTIYDKTQGVLNSQGYVTKVFGLKTKNVQAFSPFVGGAFGSGLRPQYQLFMASLAALELKRSVRVTLTRQQMFSFGHRPVTQQKLSIGAAHDGSLQAMSHTAVSETSMFEDYMEIIVNWSGMLYKCDNVNLKYQLVDLNMHTPLDMRAPGAATGVFGLECAMDELSYKLNIDPLQLRLINYAEKDNLSGHPYTSKALRQCYEQASGKFGWNKRNPQPRSVKKGSNVWVGMGMATGMWDSMVVPTRATALFGADGKLEVASATADIGTGTYTIMTQIAAETLGLPLEDVTFKLGDASLPYAYLEGGSSTAASVGTAVQKVCLQIKEELFGIAKKMDDLPFKHISLDEVTFSNGAVSINSDPSISVSLKDVMKRGDKKIIKDATTFLPNFLKTLGHVKNTHSAVFAEVEVDEDFGTVKVTRVVSAIAAGRILNPKTARSQILGGIVWGISQALHEDSFMDHNFGRFMNHNYSEYHIPVNKDINNIEVIFVDEPDSKINPLGVKGVGEIGLVGVAAAVCNAIYHATGKRVRDLPVTLDKLM